MSRSSLQEADDSAQQRVRALAPIDEVAGFMEQLTVPILLRFLPTLREMGGSHFLCPFASVDSYVEAELHRVPSKCNV